MMRSGEESGGYSSVLGGIWGILAILSLTLPLANMVAGLLDYLKMHQWLFFLVTEMVCVFVLAIAYSMREKIESYYFPERGYAPAEPSWFMSLALSIWPIVLIGIVCLVVYLHSFADIAQYSSTTKDVPASAVQTSALLLIPYLVFFSSVSATCALIGLKEYIRATPQILSDMMEDQGGRGTGAGMEEGL